jgi:hypothetical protein
MGGVSWGWLGIAPKKWNKQAKKFIEGTPEKRKQVSTLLPGQQPLYEQAVQAGLGEGAGGAFGQAADYYRNLMSDNPEELESFYAPERRNFYENTIPGLSEQFAGMGAGGLSSSGFRNAAVSAGVDLSERLGALRANLRQQGAQGLANIGQIGLGNFSQERVTQQGSPGFLSSVAPAVGSAIGSAIGGPVGGAIGGNMGGWMANGVGKNTSPYGNAASPGQAFASPRWV